MPSCTENGSLCIRAYALLDVLALPTFIEDERQALEILFQGCETRRGKLKRFGEIVSFCSANEGMWVGHYLAKAVGHQTMDKALCLPGNWTSGERGIPGLRTETALGAQPRWVTGDEHPSSACGSLTGAACVQPIACSPQLDNGRTATSVLAKHVQLKAPDDVNNTHAGGVCATSASV